MQTKSSFIAVICGLKSESAAVSASVDGSKIRIGVSGANAARAEELANEFCADGARAIISTRASPQRLKDRSVRGTGRLSWRCPNVFEGKCDE